MISNFDVSLVSLVEIGKGMFKKYPYTEYGNELRLDDEVYALYGQVSLMRTLSDEMIKTIIDMAEHMNDNLTQFNGTLTSFLDNFDENLSTTLTTILTAWQKSGKLYDLIDEALQNELDVFLVELQRLELVKADKTEVRENTDVRPINVDEFDTETKALMTIGGSVAVVGENSVGNENLKQRSVSPFNTSFLDYELVTGTQIQAEVYLSGASYVTAPTNAQVTTYKFPLKTNSYVSIENYTEANRFVVVTNNDFYTGVLRSATRLINSDNTKKRIEFFNTTGVEVIVYTANVLYSVSKPIVKQMTTIKTAVPFDLNKSIGISDTTFFDSIKTSLVVEPKASTSVFANVNGSYSLKSTGLEATVSYKVVIEPLQNITVKIASGTKNRFRVAVVNTPYLGSSGDKVVDKLIVDDSTKNEITFKNDNNGREIWVYLGLVSEGVNATISVTTEKIKMLVPFNLTKTVEIEDTTFLTSEYTEIPTLRRVGTIVYTPESGLVYLRPTGNVETMTYRIVLEPFQNVTIKIASGVNTAFRVVVMNSEITTLPLDKLVDKVVNLAQSVKEVSYINDGVGKEVWVYLGLVSEGATATILATTKKIKPLIPFADSVKRKFKVEYTSMLEDTQNPTNVESYPSMCAVKVDNSRDGEQPQPVGWLYRSENEPYNFYYASTTPENMKEIFKWNQNLAGTTYNTPEYYSPFITKYGDIVFVFRGDRLNGIGTYATARRNPIVYPAGNYSNPMIVELTGVKPTAWLQNCGADYVYDTDTFLFAEYTRPLHQNAYVWKVTEPVTNPANWTISKNFVLSGDMNVGMKHCHTVNYDPYSNLLFMTTGDDTSAAKIYSSSDNGLTWEIQMENSEKECRVLNFVFEADKIYWATDSGKTDFHFFFEVPRDSVTKVPDFSAIKELYKFKNKTGEQATYATVSIKKPDGILFLDRYDVANVEPLEIYFWSFETSSMHVLDTINPVEGVASMFGFRVEALNWYQSIGKDKRIVMGYGHPLNDNALLGNKINNRINNLALEVKESVVF